MDFMYANMTCFRCRTCETELKGNDRYIDGQCSQCRYLELVGVRTIAEYNEWLKSGRYQQEESNGISLSD